MKRLNFSIVPLLLLVPGGLASAQEACGDTTCGQGYVCQREEVEICPAMTCAPESDCDVQLQCGTAVREYCSPAPCTNDEQCGDGMVCHTTTYDTCEGAATAQCPQGMDCGDTADDVSCTQRTTSECTPTWQLPCTSDESCGEGFSCVERELCTCSAQPGASAAEPGAAMDVAGDAAPVVPDADCNCLPSGQFHCVMNYIECELDSQCPDGWTCHVSSSGGCWRDSEGNHGCDITETRQCLPQAYDTAVGSSTDMTGRAVRPPQGSSEAALGNADSDSLQGTSQQASGGGCSLVASDSRRGASGGVVALLALALALGAVLRRRQNVGK